MIEKILVVDDSAIARQMLKKAIAGGEKKYEITEAVNGKDGVEKFQEFKPDITFMDLTMPVLDGFVAIEQIKDIDKEHIIIVATADIQSESIRRVMSLGAFSVLKKPSSVDCVQEAISNAEIKFGTTG